MESLEESLSLFLKEQESRNPIYLKEGLRKALRDIDLQIERWLSSREQIFQYLKNNL